jgi:hypothetical protein
MQRVIRGRTTAPFISGYQPGVELTDQKITQTEFGDHANHQTNQGE